MPNLIIEPLAGKLLAEYAAEMREETLPDFGKLVHPNLWWSSISGLQKAIRRGEEEIAVRTALMLYMAGPKRLLRRLAVIAAEDVCFGNFPTVQIAARYAMDGIPGNGTGALHYLAALVRDMAGGVKDRSACELLVASALGMTESNVDRLTKAKLETLEKEYGDSKGDVVDRVLAGRVLVKELLLNGNKVGRVDVAGAKKLVRAATGNEGLLETTDAMLAIGGELAAFGVTIPLLWDKVVVSKLSVRENKLTPHTMINGNLSPAYDMHTREGGRAMALFTIAYKPLRVALRSRGLEPKDILGTLLFIGEGALINREFAYPFGDRLDVLNQHSQLIRRNVDVEDLPALLELTRAGIPLLNQLREKVVKSFHYSNENPKQGSLI